MNDKDQAIEFASSPRGQYIISQALWHAIVKLNEVPEPMKEESNISDMEFLLDEVFPMYKAVQLAQQGELGTLSDEQYPPIR